MGLFPAGGATVRLVRQLPGAHAMVTLLTGRQLTPDEALRVGLINTIVPAEALHDEAMQVARRIASNGSFAMQRIKWVLTRRSTSR